MKSRAYEITLAAVFTAIICAIAQLSALTPLGVPISLQVFGISLCGYSLKPKWSLFSVAAYILLGLAGLPVFTGFSGGPQVLFGTAGGFIIGFLPLVIFCSLAHKKSIILQIVLGISGLFICYILGVLWLVLISGADAILNFLVGLLPLAVKDIISVIAAFFIGKFVREKILKPKGKYL